MDKIILATGYNAVSTENNAGESVQNIIEKDCESLHEKVEDSVEMQESDGLLEKSKDDNVSVSEDDFVIKAGVLKKYKGNDSVVRIPSGVTKIGDRAFRGCSSPTEIVIPDSVTSIGYRVFSGCKSLTEIVIPGSVTSIGEKAFSGCSKLKVVKYKGTKEKWSKISGREFLPSKLLKPKIEFI